MATSLTEEEVAELAALEKEEKTIAAEDAASRERQHLDAMRLAKRLTAKHGKRGLGFEVLETTVGNIALRRPADLDVDAFAEKEDTGRADTENFVAALALHPPESELRALFAEYPGLAPAMLSASLDLVKVIRAEESKK